MVEQPLYKSRRQNYSENGQKKKEFKLESEINLLAKLGFIEVR